MTIRIVAISDTHALHRQVAVPDGDILIHAGDITKQGELETVADFNSWLDTLPHPHKVVIAGNHDFCFEKELERKTAVSTLTNCTYLQDQSVTIHGLKIYGTPWTPWFFGWAFNLERGAELRAIWDKVPTDTDILITHGPPQNYGDKTHRGEHVGCADQLEMVTQKRPKVNIFGHIHEDYGQTKNEHTHFINTSICNLQYQPIQKPTVFDWPL